MSPLKPNNQAPHVYQADEEECLLRLAIIKERFSYRAFFAEYKDRALAACSRYMEANATWPGREVDEETDDILNSFSAGMRQHGISDPVTIVICTRNRITHEQIFNLLSPRVDARTLSEEVREVVTQLFPVDPGIRQVIKIDGGDVLDALHPDFSTVCAPHERLLKIDLRTKPAHLLKEFKAFIESVEANRINDPESYAGWEQDRTRKRKETWLYLEVWKRRRMREKFKDIAAGMRISLDDAKNYFYRAYEVTQGRPYKKEQWQEWLTSDQGNGRTCHDCLDRDGCRTPCPDVLLWIELESRGQQELLLGALDFQVRDALQEYMRESQAEEEE